MAVLGTTGMRESEILGLRWDDFDTEKLVIRARRSQYRGQINPTKSEGSERGLPYGEIVSDALTRLRASVQCGKEYSFVKHGVGDGIRTRDVQIHSLSRRPESDQPVAPTESDHVGLTLNPSRTTRRREPRLAREIIDMARPLAWFMCLTQRNIPTAVQDGPICYPQRAFFGQYPGWVAASAVRDSTRLTARRGIPWILEASP